MKCWINITAEDIAEGVKMHSARCPVARAVSRRFPWAGRITATQTAIYVYPPRVAVGGVATASSPHPRSALVFRTPSAIARFISNFDAHEYVIPCAIELKLV